MVAKVGPPSMNSKALGPELSGNVMAAEKLPGRSPPHSGGEGGSSAGGHQS
jgi:hypothetical protein